MTPELIVIGASLGGLQAVERIISALPHDFMVPVVIIQHRHKETDADMLVGLLRAYCTLPIEEVEDKQPILAGHVYLAPSDYHLLVEKGAFALSRDEPANYSRPSIDVLFETAADAYGERLIGVILTGANADGARGLAKIKQYGGLAIAQDPATAENPTMPVAAIATGKMDHILALEAIGPFLVKICAPRNMRERKG